MRHAHDTPDGPLGTVVGYYSDGACLVRWEPTPDCASFESVEFRGDLRGV